MKWLDDLFGFAALSAGYLLLLAWLPVAIWIAVKLAKRFKSRATKIAGGVGLFLLFFVLPFGDEIAGRMYFNYLCATQAGVKVYQTVDLPAEYWDEAGKPKFYDEKNGNFRLEGYRIEYATGTYSPSLHIDNAGYKRIDKQSGQVLGEETDFRYWGGWMERSFSLHNTATSCKGGLERSSNLIKQIFKPKKS